MANELNPILYTDLINAVSPTRDITPNVIYVDAMSNSDIVGLAMAYNWWQAVRLPSAVAQVYSVG